VDTGTDFRFVNTSLEGKGRFCLKLLRCCYFKVSTAQCNNFTGWIQGLTAVLLVLGWRGTGGFVWSYSSVVTLKCLQHSAITVQGQTGTDFIFVNTGLEEKWWFSLKLLRCCYFKVSTVRCNNCTGWIERLTAVLLSLVWRGNGGSVWNYCSAVTLKYLQHSAIIVQGEYRDWL